LVLAHDFAPHFSDLLDVAAWLLFVAGLLKVWVCTVKLARYRSQEGFS